MKNKLNIIVLLIFYPLISFSQNGTDNKTEQSNCNNSFFDFEEQDCSGSKKCAEKDIENGIYTLYTTTGMIPRSKKESKRILKFQKKYQLEYRDFGCIAPNYKCVSSYNTQMFDYLTLKYGKKWIKKADKQLIGFNEWKLAYKR